ncbi:MAG: transcriptional repressor [SAR202 cluster bacterium]|nr:transcriptional repressor [SAR202 cluster bacterium]
MIKLPSYNGNMTNDQTDLTQQCRQLLVDNEIPVTRPRILLLEILLQHKGPIRIEDVIKLSEGKLALSSLYRIINFLKSSNLISEFQTPDNTKVIELSNLKDNHHHHVFCQTCGSVEDFELNEGTETSLQKEIQKIEALNNISVLSHSLELLSICNPCQAKIQLSH